MRQLSLLVLGLALSSSCVDTGTVVTDVELRLRGTRTEAFQGRDGWTVELTAARLAFGPLSLCPGNSAGAFCNTARGEWLDSAVVDALDEMSHGVGDLVATSGPVHSWMYDYGLVSLLTRPDLYVTDAARELGNHSVDIVGCAQRQQQRVCFQIRTDVSQSDDTEKGVPVVRVNDVDEIDNLASAERLTLTFDAREWVGGIDFQRMAADSACEAQCEPTLIQPDSQAARAVRIALAGSARPSLKWK